MFDVDIRSVYDVDSGRTLMTFPIPVSGTNITRHFMPGQWSLRVTIEGVTGESLATVELKEMP
jgi:hypothetical protein